MKDSIKTEIFKNLPEDRKAEIIGWWLAQKEEKIQSTAVLTNKKCYGLFQPSRLINKFLFCVVIGDQDGAERILKLYPELLLKRWNVRDYSGRIFIDITAFEYALWAWDTRYMCNMMLDCLPCNEEGEKIRKDLQNQYNNVKNKGVHYILNGKDYQENHFDFAPVLKALQDYVDNFDNWDPTHENHWWTKVGIAQCGLPAHVRQHYCDLKESFVPTPAFDKKKFKRSLSFYNFVTHSDEIWDRDLSELGFNLGITRAGRLRGAVARGGRERVSAADARHDLTALTALCKVRTKDFDDLNDSLQKPLQKPDLESESETWCMIF